MAGSDRTPTWIVVGRTAEGITAARVDDAGAEIDRRAVADVTAWVGAVEAAAAPRWVWNDTPSWYDPLLAAGVRVSRCHDLRLSHAILRDSADVTDATALRAATEWDAAASDTTDVAPTLFDLDTTPGSALPDALDDVLAEFHRQRTALDAAGDRGRLRLLIAAESAGALVAAELRAAGLPWDAAAHDALLTEALGPQSAPGGVPRELERAAARVRDALGDPGVSLDSQPKLLRALHRVGVLAPSTSKWELSEYDHPAIEPLLEYKRLARLMSANGWAWLAEWVHDGRFRPVYVPGGVVTGRWASSGGGALQLPRQLRGAVRADPGWVLVVADVAQLEPRVLAAMAGDTALADAARGRDLYAGIVERGTLQTRAEAKIAMLGAMYGATTGDSGRLVPALRRSFPRAMALVDEAARVGEDGGVVTTRLGRTSPPPSMQWRAAQARAGEPDATEGDESRARRWARDRGRFTRNFVVQGTAAEWALAWLADLRGRLAALPPVSEPDAAPRSGTAFARHAHLALFLHDEVIIHAPAGQADAAAHAAVEAAQTAARLLFGTFPLDFPLDVRIAATAQKD
ncbi:bifunctional 3'-5' exonuclease/DNA polymerase [Microbacterium sp. Sa4CUA7]|uniref:DNA-directed DNA polymerase n=1 Tax=Microbacterium pullorum TaxID=2762236 RepID=A0ABR8S528_9MICO|nr:bifunctional 3'-5' exonuclease/DNA polymerase [Microbacterium pullorum]MBD7958596.1 bifunctional 3'-5' exonuclease/DNA polymerase [Microbacterium pullorum]